MDVLTNRLTLTLINSSLMVQVYFVVSSFLLAFNLKIFAERNKVNGLLMLKFTFYRFWRLVPALFVVMGLYSTWGRHMGSGPLWKSVLQKESVDCQRDWWLSLLFINNYVDYSDCMPHTWYLAADTQLFFVGLLVFWLTSGRGRKIVLGLLFLVGVMIPAVHTYYQDLDALVICSPETLRNIFIKDATFHNTYKRGHTNLASYIMGFSLGLLIYHWQTSGYKIQAGFKLRILFWVSLASILVLPYYCGVFYMDAPRAPLYMRALYSALFKPLWSTSVLIFIVGLVYRFDDFINGICEWQLWALPSRLSYSMYIIHEPVIRLLFSTRTTLMHLSYLNFVELMSSVIVLSILAAIPIHLLIETPISQLMKVVSLDKTKNDSKSNGTETKEIKKNGDFMDSQNSTENKNGIHNKNGDLKDSQNFVRNRNGVSKCHLKCN